LQQTVGILEEILELVALRAESFSGELRRNLDARDGRIFRHIANFVDLDACLARERGFQLFRERGRLRVAAGKGAHEARELWLS
jgi:hypothetical protein